MPEPGCGPSRAPRLRQELRKCCAGSAGQKISVGIGRGHESFSCFEIRLFLPGFAVLVCFVLFVLVVVGLLVSFDAGTEPASHRLTTKRMMMNFQGAMTNHGQIGRCLLVGGVTTWFSWGTVKPTTSFATI